MLDLPRWKFGVVAHDVLVPFPLLLIDEVRHQGIQGLGLIELVARRKQYEYYRDRLLTFEEASA